MKVGILTYHRAFNYGAHLQACALCNRLNEEEDIDAEIIDFQMEREKKHYEVKYYSWNRTIRSLLKGRYFFERALEKSFKKAVNNPVMRKSDQYMVSDSTDDFAKFVDGKYDVIIVGSDEVWKTNNFRGFPSPYWLFGNLHCRKMSYAASSRVSFRDTLTAEEYPMVQNALQDFQFIGVRDELTYKEVKRALRHENNIHLCCDPSFLYDFDVSDTAVWDRLARKPKFDKTKKTIIVMLDNPQMADQILKNLSDFNLVSVHKHHPGFINFPDLEPMEWLCLIKNADFIIASFFHAVCFSIVFNKPFLALGTKKKKSKLAELLNDPVFASQYIDDGELSNIKERINMIMRSPRDYSEIVANNRKSFDVFLKELRRQPEQNAGSEEK